MSMSGATALVTGGAGFIGSHIVDDLLARGMRVRVYDDFSFGTEANLEQAAGDLEVVRADILDYDSLLAAMRGVDFVSHHAAQLEIFRSTDDPLADLRINTVGTLNVLKAASAAGVRKVINASSACIYGQVDGLTSESHLPEPNWAYGVSKLAAERYGTIYSRYHGLPVVSLRYGIVYGEREWYRRVLTIFLKRVVQGAAPVVFGSGDQVRDFVHVADVVRFNALCMESDRANGESYNVGTGTATTMSDLAELVVRVSGKSLEVVYEDVAEGSFSELVPDKRRNAAELKTMLLDVSKARAELGWEPEITLEEGVGREMRWAAEHLDRWERVHYTPVDA